MTPAQHYAFMGVASVKHWWVLAHVSMSRLADVFAVYGTRRRRKSLFHLDA